MAHGVVMRRFFKHLYQRLTRGWDDRELWSLDHTFAEWIVPRLERLKEIKHGVPASCMPALGGYSDEKYAIAEKIWGEIMNDMIVGFKAKQHEFDVWGEVEIGAYFRAKKLFINHLDDLWD
jgi:hypothetical protein